MNLSIAPTFRPTKRNILKVPSPFYDLPGVIQAILINLQILLKELCKRQLSWDEDIGDELRGYWEIILLELDN